MFSCVYGVNAAPTYRGREAFDDDCNEEIHDHHRDRNHEGDEVQVGERRAAAVDALLLHLRVRLVAHAWLSLVALRVGELRHEQVPVLAGGAAHEDEKGEAKRAEVDVLIHFVLEHDSAEEAGAEGSVDEKHEEYEGPDVGEGGQNVDEGVDEHLEVL